MRVAIALLVLLAACGAPAAPLSSADASIDAGVGGDAQQTGTLIITIDDGSP